MSRISLNSDFKIDTQKLVDTRLIIQANSGGGKSWLIRRILEQSHKQIQHIVIDLEGEFSTLREKYDYILASDEGDISVDPKSAKLLARKILEENVSIIIDLYELKKYLRIEFVRNFLDSLVNAPKRLWHPCLVVVDEAHHFAPQSSKSESTDAVIDLMTRGRKRGFCGILATQRISKLHKDALAEANNKLIGRTGMDIDMKRAYDELGFISKEQLHSLRNLEAGEFYAFGPAISREIIKIKVGSVQTTHPEAGAHIQTASPTPPTAKIKSVLKKLGDLPEKAFQEAKTFEDQRRQINSLKFDIKKLKKGQPSAPVAIKQEVIDKQIKLAVIKAEKGFQKQIDNRDRLISAVLNLTSKATDKINAFTSGDEKPVNIITAKPIPAIQTFERRETPSNLVNGEITGITGGCRRMLNTLVSHHPMKFSKSQLALFSKMKSSGGSFSTYMSRLRSYGFFIEEAGLIWASDEGIEYLGVSPSPPITSEEVVNMWRGLLTGGCKRMFDILVEIYPESISKDELGNQAEISRAGGSFSTYLSRLKSNDLIRVSSESVMASEELF